MQLRFVRRVDQDKNSPSFGSVVKILQHKQMIFDPAGVHFEGDWVDVPVVDEVKTSTTTEVKWDRGSI